MSNLCLCECLLDPVQALGGRILGPSVGQIRDECNEPVTQGVCSQTDVLLRSVSFSSGATSLVQRLGQLYQARCRFDVGPIQALRTLGKTLSESHPVASRRSFFPSRLSRRDRRHG